MPTLYTANLYHDDSAPDSYAIQSWQEVPDPPRTHTLDAYDFSQPDDEFGKRLLSHLPFITDHRGHDWQLCAWEAHPTHLFFGFESASHEFPIICRYDY